MLEFLAEAYSKVTLSDYFDPKFNHLHSKMEYKHDFKLLGREIKSIIENFDQIMVKLLDAQEIFRKTQLERTNNKLRQLSTIMSIKSSLPILYNPLKMMFPRINSSSKKELEDLLFWMTRYAFEIEAIPLLDTLDIDDGQGKWQRMLKTRYKNLFWKTSLTAFVDLTNKPQPDILSQSIVEMTIEKGESIEAMREKIKMLTEIEEIVEHHLTCDIMIFGSSLTLLSLEGSDLDLMFFLPSPASKIDTLRQIEGLLFSNGFIEKGPTIVQAKVPVLKCKHKRKKRMINIDIIIAEGNDSLSRIRCSHLFYHYAAYDWRVRPLMMAIRFWAKKLEINDPIGHSLSSHALTITLINYLTNGVDPPILADLQNIYPNKFGRMLRLNQLEFDAIVSGTPKRSDKHLSQLFLGFISYFSNFDIDQYGLSISKMYKRLDPEMHVTRDFAARLQPFLIQDPYDLKNAARAVYTPEYAKHIIDTFRISVELDVGVHITLEQFCENIFIAKTNKTRPRNNNVVDLLSGNYRPRPKSTSTESESGDSQGSLGFLYKDTTDEKAESDLDDEFRQFSLSSSSDSAGNCMGRMKLQ